MAKVVDLCQRKYMYCALYNQIDFLYLSLKIYFYIFLGDLPIISSRVQPLLMVKVGAESVHCPTNEYFHYQAAPVSNWLFVYCVQL